MQQEQWIFVYRKNKGIETNQDIPQDVISFTLYQEIQSDYGTFIWPSALMMIRYLYHQYINKHLVDINVMEVGSGLGVPALLLAKMGVHSMLMSDSPRYPHILDCIRKNCINNELTNCHVMELDWHTWTETDLTVIKTMDLILAADVYYDRHDIHAVTCLLAYMLYMAKPTCFVLLAYQERSARRSIQHLLDRWGLEGECIPTESLLDDIRVDYSVIQNDRDDTSHCNKRIPLSLHQSDSVYMYKITRKCCK